MATLSKVQQSAVDFLKSDPRANLRKIRYGRDTSYYLSFDYDGQRKITSATFWALFRKDKIKRIRVEGHIEIYGLNEGSEPTQ